MAGYYYAGRVQFDFQDPAPAVDYLRAHPDEIDAFTDALLGNIRALLGWGDLRTSREAFEALCRILEAVTPGPHLT